MRSRPASGLAIQVAARFNDAVGPTFQASRLVEQHVLRESDSTQGAEAWAMSARALYTSSKPRNRASRRDLCATAQRPQRYAQRGLVGPHAPARIGCSAYGSARFQVAGRA